MQPSNVASLFSVLEQVYQLKAMRRTGWTQNNVPEPETVASHCFGTSFLAMLFARQCGIDEAKSIKMALLHDVQEALVGDYTPFSDITQEEKHRRELEAAQYLSRELQNEDIVRLFCEFEEGKTDEAQFVRDLDKLDMLLQAYFYEKQHQLDLSSFFQHCKLPMFSDMLIDFRRQLEEARQRHQ